MKAYSYLNHCFLFALLYWTASPMLAQEVGEMVRIQGTITDDIYAAGGTIDIQATVDGDVVLAGGRINVGERVRGDVLAAGGLVNVRASIDDDVRLAGGDVVLSGVVGDDAIAAGGSVSLTPTAKVGGRAWLSGGRIDIGGTVAGELAATGGRIVLSGQIGGDVDLTAESVRILESAIIDGDLVYRSPQQADIAAGAQIRGTTRYDPVERPMMPIVAAAAGMSLLFVLSLGITGGAMFLLFPRFIGDAMTTIRREPWKTLGLGLAVFAATPVVIALLLVTVIGGLPAVIVGVLYLLLLLGGFLTGAFYVGDVGFGLARRERVSPARRIGSLVAALVLVMLVALVPLLGELVLLALLLLGVGALNLGMYRAYVDQ